MVSIFVKTNFSPEQQNGIVSYFDKENYIIYQGNVVDGKRDGFGRLWTKDFCYYGNWKNDLQEGDGLYKCNNNVKDICKRKYDIQSQDKNKIQNINFVDKIPIYYKGFWKNGIKDGYGKEIYDDENFYIGEFKNNTKNGDGIYYDKNGMIKFNSKWKDGELFGKIISTEYYENGNKFYEGEIVNGKKEGQGISYHNNGNKCYEGIWNNNLPDGKGKIYYTDGITLNIDGNWKNGKLDGFATTFYENGNKHYEGYNNNNKFNGLGMLWYLSGKKRYEGEFENGEIFGKGEIYYDNDSNSICKKGFFSKDEELYGINCEIYYENGNICYKGGIKDNKYCGNGKVYYPNDKIRYAGHFIEGKLHGTGISYSDNGNKLYDGEWENNKFHGGGTSYYNNNINNNMEYQGNWVHGVKCGKGQLFNQTNGQIIYFGDWKNDVYHGKGQLLDINGDLFLWGIFENGEWIKN